MNICLAIGAGSRQLPKLKVKPKHCNPESLASTSRRCDCQGLCSQANYKNCDSGIRKPLAKNQAPETLPSKTVRLETPLGCQAKLLITEALNTKLAKKSLSIFHIVSSNSIDWTEVHEPQGSSLRGMGLMSLDCQDCSSPAHASEI